MKASSQHTTASSKKKEEEEKQQSFPFLFFAMAKTSNKMLAATLALCATLFFLSPLSSNAQVPKIPKQAPLYVFGDSLYDTGMALYVDKGPSADAYPYGLTYFKKPAGRFSDGRLIPDFIAQFMNQPFPVPYLNPNLSNYDQSVNFADAAAGVLVETRPNTLNMELQTEYFVEMAQKLEKKYGKAQTLRLLKKAIYLFNVGGNDYVDLYNLNPRPLATDLKTQFMNKVLGNFSAHLTTMYNMGARKFAFHGVAPMGCLPAFLEADGSCSAELNGLSKMHNAGFEKLAKKLAVQLPGFKYSIYDFYTALTARQANGASYGFTETQSACCGSGPFNGKFTCMDKANFTLCDDPTTYLWFDAGHPTQKADQQFAQEFWAGSPPLVKPYNIKNFFLKTSN